VTSPPRLSALALALLSGCGGAGPAPAPVRAPDETPAPGKPEPPPKSALVVFDEKGPAPSCAPAKAECPDAPPPTAFLDRCRLAGFRVRQCGCDQRCTGDVSAAGRRYDASGQLKECSPARPECTPPQASSAFQDGCTERGFKLEVCGCEWLCSGDFRK
jgi:hypothetical protein